MNTNGESERRESALRRRELEPTPGAGVQPGGGQSCRADNACYIGGPSRVRDARETVSATSLMCLFCARFGEHWQGKIGPFCTECRDAMGFETRYGPIIDARMKDLNHALTVALDDVQYWTLVAEGIKHSHRCPNHAMCSAKDREHLSPCDRCRAEAAEAKLAAATAKLAELQPSEKSPVCGVSFSLEGLRWSCALPVKHYGPHASLDHDCRVEWQNNDSPLPSGINRRLDFLP